jgi:hypothetical protein
MKITTARLKEIIKEEIAEAQGIPSPEYHDDASKIGRPVSYWSDEKPRQTQGPALPGEAQQVADFVNKKIPTWLKHVEEMKENIQDRDHYMVKDSPGIKRLQRPMEEFIYHVKGLQKNLEQDKPIRRHAMGIPFSHDYVEVPSEEEERTILYVYHELAETFAAAARYVMTLGPHATEKQKQSWKQPNYTKVAEDVLVTLRRLVSGRDSKTWPGAYREKNPETDQIGGPVKYDPEKDVYPERYPYYKRPAQWLESLQKIIDEEIEVVLVEGSKTKSARKPAQNKKK